MPAPIKDAEAIAAVAVLLGKVELIRQKQFDPTLSRTEKHEFLIWLGLEVMNNLATIRQAVQVQTRQQALEALEGLARQSSRAPPPPPGKGIQHGAR